MATPPTPDIQISTTIREGGRPEPTLPDPNTPLSQGIPLWLGIVFVAMVAIPLAIAILSEMF